MLQKYKEIKVEYAIPFNKNKLANLVFTTVDPVLLMDDFNGK